MQFEATTNSVLVWKRKADESEESAKMLTRISLLLLMAMVMTGGYAYTTHSKISDLCSSLQAKSSAADSLSARKLGLDTLRSYCQ